MPRWSAERRAPFAKGAPLEQSSMRSASLSAGGSWCASRRSASPRCREGKFWKTAYPAPQRNRAAERWLMTGEIVDRLLNSCRPQILQIDEFLGGRRRRRNSADLAHQRQHPIEGGEAYIAAPGQDVFGWIDIRRENLARDVIGKLAALLDHRRDLVAVLGIVQEFVCRRHGAHKTHHRVL